MADKFFTNFVAAAAGGAAQLSEADSATAVSNPDEPAAGAVPKKSWLGRITG
jgi:hypothetical protein